MFFDCAFGMIKPTDSLSCDVIKIRDVGFNIKNWSSIKDINILNLQLRTGNSSQLENR